MTAPVPLDPIEVAPSYQRAAKSIEQAILSGRFALGQLLPTEGELASQLALNRSTVREALRSLEDTGLLVRTVGRRLMVSMPRTELISAASSFSSEQLYARRGNTTPLPCQRRPST